MIRNTAKEPVKTAGLRALYDMVWNHLSSGTRAARAAEARRAARCEDANEPEITRSHAAAQTFQPRATAMFASTAQSLSADHFAPSRLVEPDLSVSDTRLVGRSRTGTAEKSIPDTMIAAARKLVLKERERRHEPAGHNASVTAPEDERAYQRRDDLRLQGDRKIASR